LTVPFPTARPPPKSYLSGSIRTQALDEARAAEARGAAAAAAAAVKTAELLRQLAELAAQNQRLLDKQAKLTHANEVRSLRIGRFGGLGYGPTWRRVLGRGTAPTFVLRTCIPLYGIYS
jgi:hypothetical protein